MNALSLVPAEKIEQDPRNLAFLFPSMPLAKYKKATDEYYKLLAIRAVEQAAKINEQLLVPAGCLHWERKKAFQENNVRIFGKSYYLINRNDLTNNEVLKYQDMTRGN